MQRFWQIEALFVILTLATGISAQTLTPSEKPADPLHAWVGLESPSDLDSWVQWHISEERRLVAELLAVRGTRTLENTLAPFDDAQAELDVAGREMYALFQVHAQSKIRDKAQELIEKLSTENDALGLNRDVYEALRAIELSKADAVTKHYVDRTLLGYRLTGADKDPATREAVRKLFDQMTQIGLKFKRNIQDDVRKIEITDKAELEGLPGDFIERHKPAADGKIVLTTDPPDVGPVMNYAKSPALRRAMYLARRQRCYPANKELILELLAVRHKTANLLGFSTWADLAIADTMMGSVAKLRIFLDESDRVTQAAAKKEFDLLSSFVARQDRKALPLTPPDLAYWSEQYRRSAYDFDSQSLRPYLPYQTVEAGILKVASRLFHLEFREVRDAPVWDPTVETYDVYDELDGGAKAGRMYLDLHPREGKDKWFSAPPLIPGTRGRQLPEALLIGNFSGGTAGDPGLLQFFEAETFFHEFGHMMHNILGGRQRWEGQSGASTEFDFLEAPSLMLEQMVRSPAILQTFAKHYQTGETIPTSLIAKMNRAGLFQRAGELRSHLGLGTFLLDLHNRRPEDMDLDVLYKADYARFNSVPSLEGDHSYASLDHLIGLSSNYYMYELDRAIALDIYAQFDEKRILDGPAALRYRRTILEPGSSKPASELLRDFLGRPQSMDALKHWLDEEFEAPPQ
jgi:thimet oligopeptidase